MASVAGFETKLSGARTRFEAVGSQLFTDDLPGSYSMVTMERTLDTGGIYSLIDAGQTGIMRQWVGDKQRDSFRLYRKDIAVEVFEKTFALKRREIIEDTTDAINQKIDTWLASQAQVFDYKVWGSFLSNPTGIDGVSLLNDSHPFGASGGTWDNKTTDDLSVSSYNAGKVAMRSLKGEAGRFMNLRPTHLFVGPAKEQIAKEITGAERAVAIGTGGSEVTSAAVAATTIPNVFTGDVTVVIVEHFADGTHDSDWLLVDMSKGVAPMCLVRQRDPELIEMTDMTSPQRFNRDEFEWSVEADFGFDGAYPHVVYGKLS